MSAAIYAAEFKERAFQSLMNHGTNQFHRSFAMDHIVRAEACRLSVEVPMAQLCCIEDDSQGSVFFDITSYGENVCLGAWDLGFRGTPPPTVVTSMHYKKEAIPLPNEVLKIYGEAMMEDGVPQLKYVVNVERANVDTLVVIGFLSLALKTPSVPAAIAAPTAPQDAPTPQDE